MPSMNIRGNAMLNSADGYAFTNKYQAYSRTECMCAFCCTWATLDTNTHTEHSHMRTRPYDAQPLNTQQCMVLFINNDQTRAV